MENTPGTNTTITYNVPLLEGAERFRVFEEAYATRELYAMRETPLGLIRYGYADGRVTVDGKPPKNRRIALITLFGMNDIAPVTIQITRYAQYNLGVPTPRHIVKNVFSSDPGIVAIIDNEVMEITEILTSKLSRDNGLPFTQKSDSSQMAKPGYIPTIACELKIRSTSQQINKTSALDGTIDVVARPSDLKIFEMVKIPRQNAIKKCRKEKWRKAHSFVLNKLNGVTEPMGATCIAQLPRLMGI